MSKVKWGESSRKQKYNTTRLSFGPSKNKEARIVPVNGVVEATVTSIVSLPAYDKGEDKCFVYNLTELTSKKELSVIPGTDLKAQFAAIDVKVGSTIQITYLGSFPTKNGHKVKRFDVKMAA